MFACMVVNPIRVCRYVFYSGSGIRLDIHDDFIGGPAPDAYLWLDPTVAQ